MAPSLFREGFGSHRDLHPRHASRDGAGKPSHPLGSRQAAGSSGIGRGAARSPYASRRFGWEAEGPVWGWGRVGGCIQRDKECCLWAHYSTWLELHRFVESLSLQCRSLRCPHHAKGLSQG